MRTLILLGILGLGHVSYAQTSKSPSTRPANTPAKPCGISPDAREVIMNLVRDRFSSLEDAEVENVYKNWQTYLDQAAVCRNKIGDSAAQLSGADDLGYLWAFMAFYDNARYEREAALSKRVMDQSAAQAGKDAEIINRLGNAPPSLGPLFEQPTPIHVTCGANGRCSGEVLTPRPLPILPLSLTCHVVLQQAECDGDLEPPIGTRIR